MSKNDDDAEGWELVDVPPPKRPRGPRAVRGRARPAGISPAEPRMRLPVSVKAARPIQLPPLQSLQAEPQPSEPSSPEDDTLPPLISAKEMASPPPAQGFKDGISLSDLSRAFTQFTRGIRDRDPDEPPKPRRKEWATHFWRAQSNECYTKFNGLEGFEIGGKGKGPWETKTWLNAATVESHIDPREKVMSTPFISIYDNFNDAKARAGYLLMLGHTDVCVAEIVVPNWKNSRVEGTFYGRSIHLPIITDGDGTRFMSILTARDYLGVQLRERGEWLALGSIPSNLVNLIMPYNSVAVMDREMGTNKPPIEDEE